MVHGDGIACPIAMGIDSVGMFFTVALEYGQIIDHSGFTLQINLSKGMGIGKFGFIMGERIADVSGVRKGSDYFGFGIIEGDTDAMNKIKLSAMNAQIP